MLSTSASAAALHVSRGTAQNRLDRLIHDGVIQGFTVLVRKDIDERLIRALMTIQLAGQTTTAVIARREGTPPKGWLGPWISQSRATPDLLA